MTTNAAAQPGFWPYAKQLISRYPKRSFSILVCFVVAGILEGISAGSLLPLLTSFEDSGLAENAIMNFYNKIFSALNLNNDAGVILCLIIGLTFLKSGVQFLAMRQVGNATASMANQLRQDFIFALMQARWSYFATASTGHITNSLITETDRAALSYLNLCKMIADSMIVTVYVVVAACISAHVTITAVAGSVILMFTLNKLVTIVKQAGREQTHLFKTLSGLITDTLASFKAIKAMHREEYFRQILTKDTKGLWIAKRKEVLGTEMLAVARDPLIITFVALGIYAAYSYATLSLSELIVLAFMFLRVTQKMAHIQMSYQKTVAQESAYWAISSATKRAQEAREVFSGNVAPSFKKSIRVENVGFSHHREGGPREEVLSGVSCNFPVNKFNAIIGPSGSGKTTLIDIILGFYKPDSGRVLVDDQPLDVIDMNAWRKSIGYIPQDGFLLHDSVVNNITLGQDIPRAVVEEALEKAEVMAFVKTLPQGLDTVVGERGLLFSGGQRQRITLARALARSPSLLLLDEPTSALDKDTETQILKTLKELAKTMTIIVISHSERVKSYADNVYALEKGHLANAA